MKQSFVAAVFAALITTALAERPSTDELAVRLGVDAWFSARTSSTGQFDFAKLKAIYRPDVEFTDPATGNSASARGFNAYAAHLQPLARQTEKLEARPGGDVSISLNGSTAMSSFTFRPQGLYKDGRAITCGARVSLTWERQNGLWQIARESTTPLPLAELVTAK